MILDSMKTYSMKKNIIFAAVLILLAVIGRLVPHVWNVTPVVAVSLLAGYILPRKWAITVPLVAMFIADLSLGFYHLPVMLTVYASFALVSLIGSWIKEIKPHRLLAATLASSTLFFLTTNFAVWASGTWYPKTAAGLLLAYEMGIPFFRNMALGDVIFTAVLFSAWSAAAALAPAILAGKGEKVWPAPRRVHQKSF